METISNSLRLNKLSIHHRSSNTNISLWISEELLPLKKCLESSEGKKKEIIKIPWCESFTCSSTSETCHSRYCRILH